MKENDDAVLMWNRVPVLTTKMLSERLGIFEVNIRVNFGENKQRYVENEDYFVLQGNDLKVFKATLRKLNLHSEAVAKNTKIVNLWAEGGAFNHAKSAATDEAWEAFLYLKNSYFRQREALKAIKEAYNDNPLLPHTTRPVQLANSKEANKVQYEKGGVKQTVDYNFRSCFSISGKTPKELKEMAKKFGLKAKQMSSGKEVCRHLFPVAAATMSLTDAFCNNGATLDEILPLAKSVMPVFEKMEQMGMLKKAS